MKLDYNAPVVLTFALVCFAVMALSIFMTEQTVAVFLTTPFEFNSAYTLDYVRVLSHAFVHRDWQHLVGNVVVILLIGPVIEEKYGSIALLVMVAMTLTITGVINALFFSSSLLGASSIAFMLILLTSITHLQRRRVPITFVLIVLVYLVPDFLDASHLLMMSPIAHIAGGICASVFATFLPVHQADDAGETAHISVRPQ